MFPTVTAEVLAETKGLKIPFSAQYAKSGMTSVGCARFKYSSPTS
jgi:hypothetical protein